MRRITGPSFQTGNAVCLRRSYHVKLFVYTRYYELLAKRFIYGNRLLGLEKPDSIKRLIEGIDSDAR